MYAFIDNINIDILLIDQPVKMLDDNPAYDTTEPSTTGTTPCTTNCEEDDTLSYIVGSVCGATVLAVLIWYIVMKVKESKKEGQLAIAVSIRRLSHPI